MMKLNDNSEHKQFVLNYKHFPHVKGSVYNTPITFQVNSSVSLFQGNEKP